MSQSKAKAARKAEAEKQAHPFIFRAVEYKVVGHDTLEQFTERIPVAGDPPEGFTRFAVGFVVKKMEPRLAPVPIKLEFAIQVDADTPAEALQKILHEMKTQLPAQEKELESRITRKLLSGDDIKGKIPVPAALRGGPSGIVRKGH